MMQPQKLVAVAALLGCLPITSCKTGQAISHKDDFKQAYIYGFPMIAAYKAMHEFNIYKTNVQYKGPFNTIVNDARVFTPKDTAIVTPNSDTPYSRCCRQICERSRWWSACLPSRKAATTPCSSSTCTRLITDVGSRATGNDAGCYLIAGPGWNGETPKGIKKVFHPETQFSLLIFRTQLFNPADMPNVKKIQAGYTRALSAYLKQPAPPAAPAIDWPDFTDEAFKMDFPKYLSFLLQFCPRSFGCSRRPRGELPR